MHVNGAGTEEEAAVSCPYVRDSQVASAMTQQTPCQPIWVSAHSSGVAQGSWRALSNEQSRTKKPKEILSTKVNLKALERKQH